MKTFLWVSFLVGSMVVCSGCRRTVYQGKETVMGPIIARITIVSQRAPADQLESAAKAAFARINKVDSLMSHYKEASDVSRLNESPADTWVKVDPTTFQVLEESQRTSELSGGAFDVTVQPLCTLWGFWPVRQAIIPSDEEIQKTLSHVGYKKLSLNRSQRSVLKGDTELKVDLGAIAKGYAVDRAMEALRNRGIKNALVQIGGETRAVGTNKLGKPWRIGVLHPLRPGYLTILELSNRAVATSGDYMNFFVLDGKRYSHLIDPRTGKPISNDVCSVTIVARTCTEADALATAVSVMGMEEGLKLVEALPETEAIVVKRRGEGDELEIRTTTGLKRLTFTP